MILNANLQLQYSSAVKKNRLIRMSGFAKCLITNVVQWQPNSGHNRLASTASCQWKNDSYSTITPTFRSGRSAGFSQAAFLTSLTEVFLSFSCKTYVARNGVNPGKNLGCPLPPSFPTFNISSSLPNRLTPSFCPFSPALSSLPYFPSRTFP